MGLVPSQHLCPSAQGDPAAMAVVGSGVCHAVFTEQWKGLRPRCQLERVIVWHSSSIAVSRGVGLELGEGNGNPLQDSCLETPMDGGAW